MTEDEYYNNIKKSQRLALAGGICAGVSLIIGGILLCSIGLVLGILALVKANRVSNENYLSEEEFKKVRKSAILAILVSVIAFVLNIVTVILFMPEILALVSSMQSGAIPGIGTMNGSYTTTPSVTWG